MELKNMIGMIDDADIKRRELAIINSEYENLFEQYRIAKSLMSGKREEMYAKERELHNCSHPLIIIYNHSGFDLTHFNGQCVCCGYEFLEKCFSNDNSIDIQTLLQNSESDEICEFIKRRLKEISEINPNISLEEAKNIIAQELPEFEKSLVEKRKTKSGKGRKRVRKDVITK